MHPRLPLPLLVWLASLVASGARGDVYLDNFGETQASGFTQARSDRWLATRFTTDNSAGAFAVASVTLAMGGELVAGGNFFVALYSNTGLNTPDAQLGANLTGSSTPTPAGNFTYTASGVTLSPNTSYWVVLGVSSGAANYRAAFNETTGTTGGWTIPATDAFYRSTDLGSSWAYVSDLPLRYSITATAVPEPGHYAALAAAGALGLVLWRRRLARPKGFEGFRN